MGGSHHQCERDLRSSHERQRTYDPIGTAEIIYVQARDETTLENYVLPVIQKFKSMVTVQFNRTWAQQTLQRAATTPSVLANIQVAPQAVSPAIGFLTFNLRPFFPFVATPAITTGLTYPIIISFFSFSFYLPIHMKSTQSFSHRQLKFYQLIFCRWLATITAYCMHPPF